MRVLYAVLIIALAACEPAPISARSGAPFLGPFQSYQSLSKVRELALEQKMTWEIIETPESYAVKKVPDVPFQIHVVEADGYRHENLVARLRFELLNDQLASVWLFPSGPSAWEAVEQRFGTLPVTGGSRDVSPEISAIVGTDFKGRKYVRLEDKRLREEWDSLRRKYL